MTARKPLGKCAALDQNGRRCRRQAIVIESYHGNDELYGFFSEPKGRTWVRVEFCGKHQSTHTINQRKR